MRTMKLLLAVASILFLLTVCMSAGAETLRGNKQSCEGLSSVVMQAGEIRDSGVPWDVFEPRLNEMIAEARANPQSFVQNDEDAKFITKSLKLLWKNLNDIPLLVAAAVYEKCMEQPPKEREAQ